MPRGRNFNQCLLVLSPQQIRFYPCMRGKCDPELTRGSDRELWQVGAASMQRQQQQKQQSRVWGWEWDSQQWKLQWSGWCASIRRDISENQWSSLAKPLMGWCMFLPTFWRLEIAKAGKRRSYEVKVKVKMLNSETMKLLHHIPLITLGGMMQLFYWPSKLLQKWLTACSLLLIEFF